MSLALLWQLPRDIPGSSAEYIPTLSAEITWKWYEAMRIGSINLLLLLLTIALLVALFSTAAERKVTARSVFGCTFMMMVLLAGYVQFFGMVTGITHAFAHLIVEEDQIEKYQEDWEKASDPDYLKSLSPEETEKLPWYARLSLAAFTLTPAMVTFTGLVEIAATLIFFLVMTGMYMLWRLLTQILFAMGPLCIVFGVIPNWGSKVTMSWIGAVIQVGLWQLWNAGIALIVNNAQKYFLATPPIKVAIDTIMGDPVAVPNRYESVIIQVVCVFLMLAGPIFIGLLFPHSKFATFASWGVISAAQSTTRVVVGAGTSVLKAVAVKGK